MRSAVVVRQDMEWETDALAALDRASGTRLADRYRERRADRAFRDRALRDRATSPGRPASDAPEHVVVVAVDCLRADALESPEAHCASSAPTPFLDGLDGATAIAPSTWTFPSVTSLLTGQYPHRHGATRRTDSFEDSVADVIGLPPKSSATGIAELFAGAGYDTYGGFGMLVPFLALSGRFRTHRLHDDAAADRVLADHLSWLRERRDRPTFSYLHLADPHEPVAPPRDYRQAHDVDASIPDIRGWRYEDVVEDSPAVERYRDHRRRLYRAAVEYADNRLGAYYRRVSELAGDVAFAVVGDHGEGFWERARHAADNFADSRPARCVGHGGAPYEAITRVLLRTAGRDLDADFGSDDLLSLVDLAPTLADAAGLDLDADGASLRREVPDDRTLLVESVRYGYEKRAAYADGHKLVVSQGDDYAEGFAVPEDEPADLPPDLESDLRAALPRWPDGERVEETEAGASRSVERRLADLGYR